MNVLMLGWEFPPYNVGGLGVACHGLTKSLSKQGVNVTFVLPKVPKSVQHAFLKVIGANHEEVVTTIEVPSLLTPYMSSKQYAEYKTYVDEYAPDNPYGQNLFMEVHRYADQVANIAKKSSYDVIHAHDWMTFLGGIAAKKATNTPLVVHIHNTAFDRSGGNPNQYEYDIEYQGFHAADKIISVSNYIKQSLVTNYGISPDKIEVIHNGIDLESYGQIEHKSKMDKKIVLFAGRVTLQKGPDYFVRVAEKISKKRDDVHFVLAGYGDMLPQTIELVATLGLSSKFIFPGKYSKEEGEKLMSMAHVFVMPSVSEPFGLVPLEAMIQKTPVIISKQSGVSEILQHALKTDFWDTHQLASKIISVLEYPVLTEQLVDYGHQEVKAYTWDPAATKCKDLYRRLAW